MVKKQNIFILFFLNRKKNSKIVLLKTNIAEFTLCDNELAIFGVTE